MTPVPHFLRVVRALAMVSSTALPDAATLTEGCEGQVAPTGDGAAGERGGLVMGVQAMPAGGGQGGSG